MNAIYIIFALIILLLGLGVWIVKRYIKKKKNEIALQNQIPQDLLNDFEYAENKMKGGLQDDNTNNQTYPNTILWELWKGKRVTGTSGTVNKSEQTNVSRELCSVPIGREDIQNGVTTSPNENTIKSGQSKPNSNPNFFSRFRRKSIN